MRGGVGVRFVAVTAAAMETLSPAAAAVRADRRLDRDLRDTATSADHQGWWTSGAGDLLRAPSLGKQLSDGVTQMGARLYSPFVAAFPLQHSVAMSPEWLVATPARAIASQLPRHRRRRTPDALSDLPHRRVCLLQVSGLNALVLRQIPPADLADC